jgi:hypothetical protein
VVLVQDVSRLEPEFMTTLRGFVEAGGGLWLFADPAWDAGHYSGEAWAGLLPVDLAGPEGAPPGDPWRIRWAPALTGHPWAAALDDGGLDGVASSQFFRVVAAEPRAGASVLARFGSGSPALVEGSVGRGRVLAFLGPLLPEWTSLPLSPSFVPWVHEGLRYLASARWPGVIGSEVGEPVSGEIDAAPAGAVTLRPYGVEGDAAVESPAAGIESLALAPAGLGGLRYTSAPVGRPGLYSVERAGKVLSVFAVGTHPGESRLDRLSDADVEALAATAGANALTGTGPLDESVARGRHGLDLTRLLVAAALLLLLVETWLLR